MEELSEETKAWLAVRKAEALKIDPETAIVDWQFGQKMDPYGVHEDLPDEWDSVGREFFCRRPDGDVWVHLHDLPDDTAKALWTKIDAGTANWNPVTQAARQEWADILHRASKGRMRLVGDPPPSSEVARCRQGQGRFRAT